MLRLMHVHAHPDDESSKGAASTAMYVAQGVDVHVATCTGGERGSILNPNMDRPDVLANIGEIRRQEMDRAREILGMHPGLAGFRRLRLPRGRPAAARCPRAASRCSRWRWRPSRWCGSCAASSRTWSRRTTRTAATRIPTTSCTHNVTVAAFDAAGDPDAYPGAGEPWQPLKLYYHHSFHRERIPGAARRDAAPGHWSRPYAERLADWEPDPDRLRSDHHPRAVRGLLRRPGPGAAGPRHPDRPGGPVVRLSRSRSTRRRGRPRTSSWWSATSTRRLPEDGSLRRSPRDC